MAPDGWPRYPQDLPGAWSAIQDIRERIDRMQTADEVAEAVTTALKREHRLGLTVAQKAGGALVAGIVAAGAVLQIVQAVH